jgi:hypothetical protein
MAQSDSLPPPRLTIADWFSPEYHHIKNTRGNEVVVRGYFPWQLDGIDMLTRISTPYTTSSPGKSVSGQSLINDFPSGPTGFGDMEIYNLAQWQWSWGQTSLGPLIMFPTGTRSGVGKGQWTAGPAGGVNFMDDRWTFGAFTQNYFSFASNPGVMPIAKTKLQPIVDLSLDDGWSVGTSNMNFNYNWSRSAFSNIPLGVELGKSFKIGNEDVKLMGQVEYNFASTSGASGWTLRLTWQFILPRFY